MTKGLNFEKSLEKLEAIVKKLEGGDLSLEDSLKNFKEGIRLSSVCQQKLNETEKKVEILLTKNGIKKEPFSVN